MAVGALGRPPQGHPRGRLVAPDGSPGGRRVTLTQGGGGWPPVGGVQFVAGRSWFVRGLVGPVRRTRVFGAAGL